MCNQQLENTTGTKLPHSNTLCGQQLCGKKYIHDRNQNIEFNIVPQCCCSTTAVPSVQLIEKNSPRPVQITGGSDLV